MSGVIIAKLAGELDSKNVLAYYWCNLLEVAVVAQGSVLSRAMEPLWVMDRCKGHAVAMQHERVAWWVPSDSWTRPERRPGCEWGTASRADCHYRCRGRRGVRCRPLSVRRWSDPFPSVVRLPELGVV